MNPPPSPRRRFLVLLLAACGVLASCSWLADKPTPTENPNAPKLVGRITSISPGRQFVLIESYGTWNVPTGSILSVQGPDGRSANLIVTGELLRHNAAADIQSGNLAIGDGVYLQPTPKNSAQEPDSAPATSPKPAADAPAENR